MTLRLEVVRRRAGRSGYRERRFHVSERVANVQLHARDEAESLRREIVSRGQRAFARQADVSREAEVPQLVRTVEQDLGPIDILLLATNSDITGQTINLNGGWYMSEKECRLRGQVLQLYIVVTKCGAGPEAHDATAC